MTPVIIVSLFKWFFPALYNKIKRRRWFLRKKSQLNRKEILTISGEFHESSNQFQKSFIEDIVNSSDKDNIQISKSSLTNTIYFERAVVLSFMGSNDINSIDFWYSWYFWVLMDQIIFQEYNDSYTRWVELTVGCPIPIEKQSNTGNWTRVPPYKIIEKIKYDEKLWKSYIDLFINGCYLLIPMNIEINKFFIKLLKTNKSFWKNPYELILESCVVEAISPELKYGRI